MIRKIIVVLSQQAWVAKLVARWLAFPEIQVRTPPGANEYEQIFLSVSHMYVNPPPFLQYSPFTESCNQLELGVFQIQ